tara:strand:- start:133 stop:336 length:204 start_codon:yes stop_codon:yes gene_type:complete
MTDLEERRLKVVREHMALEITHEWDAVIDTFDHPRYELYGSGTDIRRRGSGAQIFRDVAHALSRPGQ